MVDLKGNLGDFQKYLEGINFPAKKEDLENQMKEKGAPQEIIEKIKTFAGDRFNNIQELTRHFTKND